MKDCVQDIFIKLTVFSAARCTRLHFKHKVIRIMAIFFQCLNDDSNKSSLDYFDRIGDFIMFW